MREVPFAAAAPGGGWTERRVLPVHAVDASWLPPGLDGLLITSDLQGYEKRRGAARLVSYGLIDEMRDLARNGIDPSAPRIGVVLAGDLYAHEDLTSRGGLGDVRPVWRAFADAFRWVVGVAGNHDDFGDGPQVGSNMVRFQSEERTHVLREGEPTRLDDIVFAGVNGIIGQPGRPWRKRDVDFVHDLGLALATGPDILVLHQPPAIDSGLSRERGDRRVTEVLERVTERPPLVVCGHRHWSSWLRILDNGLPVVNVDGRAVLLLRETIPGTSATN